MKRILAFIVLLATSLVLTDVAEAQDFIIVAQSESPVTITEYEAEYKEGGTYSREGVHHEADFENVSGKNIRAIKLGFVSFNIFNEFIDRFAGIDMDELDAGDDSGGTWVSVAASDFSFYTGVAYVSKVRYSDGTMWEANLDSVAESIRDVQDDFEADLLKEDSGNDS